MMSRMSTLLRWGALLTLTALVGCEGNGGINDGPQVFTQVDRVGKPAVNAIFATVANNQRQNNVNDNPTDDPNVLRPEIVAFLQGTAHRSTATANAVAAVLSPSVLEVDLSQLGPAAYLAVETNGATETTAHARFGGRGLSDDVIDTDLNLIFGNGPVTLGLVTVDDGAETPALTSDHVDATTAPKHFQDGSESFAVSFPYLGSPR